MTSIRTRRRAKCRGRCKGRWFAGIIVRRNSTWAYFSMSHVGSIGNIVSILSPLSAWLSKNQCYCSSRLEFAQKDSGRAKPSSLRPLSLSSKARIYALLCPSYLSGVPSRSTIGSTNIESRLSHDISFPSYCSRRSFPNSPQLLEFYQINWDDAALN
ncbi:hypothetical protein EI94DRAFT_1067296 [Lactarius quietus]|nr:hypothetical protein EI94DRAFT_1067296 [Lactarius quietus]